MKTTVLLEDSNNQREYAERRHKKDWVVRSVNIIAVIGWLCAFVSLMLIDQAKPEIEDFFSRLLNHRVRDYWDVALLRIGVGALTVSFVTCVTGFFVNMIRHRRKTDRYNKSIIILAAITFIMLIVFIGKLM